MGVVELHRCLGDEIEHGRRVHGAAHGLVGTGKQLSRGQAAQVGKAVAQRLADADELLDIAKAVLEADQVGAGVGQHLQAGRRQAAAATVVDHYAKLHALAHSLHVGDQAFLAGFGQVVGQQQNALGAQALSLLGVLDGQRGATASARNDGRAVLAGGQGDLDHFAVFAGLQREELTRATCGKQCRSAVGLQPLQAIGIGLGSKAQFAVEVGQRKGQQAGLQYAFEVLWGHVQAPLGEKSGRVLLPARQGRAPGTREIHVVCHRTT